MKADIINPHYFKETKWYTVWRLIAFTGFILIGLDSLANRFYETYQTPELPWFVILLFFIVCIVGLILESSLFTRIGTLKLADDILVVDLDANGQHIDLTQVNKVKIRKTRYRFYDIKIDNASFTIDCTKQELLALKTTFQKHGVVVDHRRFL